MILSRHLARKQRRAGAGRNDHRCRGPSGTGSTSSQESPEQFDAIFNRYDASKR
jgi:hypothetical protein